MDLIIKARISKTREVKEPGKHGGKFFISKKTGLLRYGTEPLSHPVHKVEVHASHKLQPFTPASDAHNMLSFLREKHYPYAVALKNLISYFTANGVEDPKAAAHDALIQMHAGGGVTLHHNEEKQMSEKEGSGEVIEQVVPSEKKVRAPRASNKLFPEESDKDEEEDDAYWTKCEVPIPLEADLTPEKPLAFTYGGKRIVTKGLSSRMLRRFCGVLAQHEAGKDPKYLGESWKQLCKNFSKDFNDALAQAGIKTKVQVGDAKFGETLRQVAVHKAAEDKAKAGKVVIAKKDRKEKYGLVDGKKVEINSETLPGEGIYVGTGGKSNQIGRWIPAITHKDCTMNSSSKPKGWKGEWVKKPNALWCVKWKQRVGIRRQDKHPSGQGADRRWAADSKFVIDSRLKRFKGVYDMTAILPKLRKQYQADMESSNPALREAAFVVMLMDTMHARSGGGGSELSEGITQFKVGSLHPDGGYLFSAKDGIVWDSKKVVTLSPPDRQKFKAMPNRAGGPSGLVGNPVAKRLYQQLVAGKKPDDLLFNTPRADLAGNANRWLKHYAKKANGEKIKTSLHKFRHVHAQIIFDAEYAKFEPGIKMRVKTHGKGSDEVRSYVNKVCTHCFELVAVKLGHRRRVKGEQGKSKTKKTSSQMELGAATTRTSYMNLAAVEEKTQKVGVSVLKNTERKKFGIPIVEKEKKAKKVKKSFVTLSEWVQGNEPRFEKALDTTTYEPDPLATDLSPEEKASIEDFKETEALLLASVREPGQSRDVPNDDLLKADALAEKYGKKIPTCRYCNRQAVYIIYTNTREKVPVCKVHLKLKDEMSKAILTKKTEKAPKPAKAPSKSSGRSVSAKTGKKTYKYQGQNPTTGGKKGPPPKKGPVPQTPVEDAPPPKIDVQELANILHTTVGALKVYASKFKDADHFVSYFSHKARTFTLKHNVGRDKLRRLYESLRESDTPTPGV